MRLHKGYPLEGAKFSEPNVVSTLKFKLQFGLYGFIMESDLVRIDRAIKKKIS